jgi:trigger factor
MPYVSEDTMNRTASLVAATALSSVIALGALAGCDASGTSADATADEAAAAQTDAATEEDATTEAEATAEKDATTEEDADATTDDADDAETFDFSAGLDENGLWEGVDASSLVTLPEDYLSVQVPAEEVDPTDDEIQAQVDQLLSSYTTYETVTDRAVADGDTVNIDYVGTVDGEEFSGGNTNGAGTTVIIGTTSYVDDFLDQLVGHTPGETVTVEVTFPDDYSDTEVAGKDAVFETTINYITETSTPELTDEWVAEQLADTYGWTTADEVTAYIADSLRDSALEAYLQSYVVDGATVSELPEVIVTAQENMLVYQYQYYADMFGTDLESILSMMAGVETVDELLESNQETIEDAATAYLVFQAIVEQNGLTASDDDVTDYVQAMTGSDDVATYEEAFGMPYLKLGVLIDDAILLLEDGAQVA